MPKIPDTAQAILWGALAAGGMLAMLVNDQSIDSRGLGGLCLFWGGFVALLVGGGGLLGVVIEGIIREIRDIWHENDKPVRSHRRRR